LKIVYIIIEIVILIHSLTNQPEMKQTILGSGGAIGIPLARELKKYTDEIRLVSRNPLKVNVTDELFPLDVNNTGKLSEAIRGSGIVYVTIGFEYNTRVWQKTWPPFLKSVIDACREHGSKLVFFDNVYMYADSAIPHMTEQSEVQPSSRKGVLRKELSEMITGAVEKNELTALIARAADFYGPENKNSALALMVAENFLKGKKAQVFGDPSRIHTYTYTPDAAKATALLGNAPEAYNQVWHLPTTNAPVTGYQWIEMIAGELNVKPRQQKVANWMLRLVGLFVPVMREFPEMMYQFEQDYIFDSSKFEKMFGWQATSPQEGIRSMIQSMKNEK
jgi:nucleoside-diphosphate-sugar epimerase